MKRWLLVSFMAMVAGSLVAVFAGLSDNSALAMTAGIINVVVGLIFLGLYIRYSWAENPLAVDDSRHRANMPGIVLALDYQGRKAARLMGRRNRGT
jgi:hypothetical protein